MFWGPWRLPRWLQNGTLADFSPLRRHLGATCQQHGGQDGNLQATMPDLGRTGAVLGPSWAILAPSWGHLGAILGDLGATCGHVGAFCSHLGLSWARVGGIWGDLGTIFGYLGALRGHIVAIWGYVYLGLRKDMKTFTSICGYTLHIKIYTGSGIIAHWFHILYHPRNYRTSLSVSVASRFGQNCANN